MAAAGITLFAAGIYASKHSTGVMARYFEARLMKPALIRDTSRISPFDAVAHPIQVLLSLTITYRPLLFDN